VKIDRPKGRLGIDMPVTRAYILLGPWRMSSTPFGEHLRREREMRGVSLDEIAAATRISTRFLEALEGERWDQLPGGAFNRGFIRSIARFLGIDEDGLVAEYAYERESVKAERIVAPSQRIPRDYRPAVVATALALLLAVGGIWGLSRYGSQILASIHNRFAASANSTAASTPFPAAAPSHATVDTPLPANPTAAAPSPRDGTSVSDASTAGPPGASMAAPEPSDLALIITASTQVKLAVIADGKDAFRGKLQPNEAKQFEAQDTIEIVSNKSAALRLNLNGHLIPWAASPNTPRRMTLRRSELSTPAEPSH
jgi:cytoskeleton protein RodZ